MPSFGAKLKQQREQRGITLEEISQTTKIGSRFLHALEEDRFDQLPGGIFNKGFVRAYARSVGLDEEEAIANYLEATGAIPDKPDSQVPLPELPPEADTDGDRLPWGALAIVLLIVALGLAVWGFYSREVGTASQQTPSVSHKGNTPETASAPAVRSSPPTTIIAVGQKAPAVALGGSAGSKMGEKPASALTEPLNVRINAREDSWMSIAADGKQIMSGTMSAATEKSVHGLHEIVVKVGNAGGLDFEFNGKKLPGQGNTGEAKTLVFDAAGAHSPPPAPASPPDQNSSAPSP